MKIENRIQTVLYINGKPTMVQPLEGMQLCIITNVKQHLPTCYFVLPDFGQQIQNSNPVVDGSEFGIGLTDTHGKKYIGSYISFGTPIRKPLRDSPNIMLYHLTGRFNSIPFVTSSPNQAFTGTSLQVMQQIASNNGFTLKSNDITNDLMTWQPGKRSWSKLADYIKQHGWVNPQSAMAWGIDEFSNLYYYNIPKIFSSDVPLNAYIYFGEPELEKNPSITQNNTFLALQYQAKNSSGVYNDLGGYGMRTAQPNLQGTINKYLDVSGSVFGNSLDISQNLSSQIQPLSRMSLPPIDCGNGHPNYIQAKHQNHRLLCTYVQNIYVMINQQTGLNLFDKVKFTANVDKTTNNVVNGIYTVTAINRFVFSSYYYEKIELVNNGPIVNNGGLLQ